MTPARTSKPMAPSAAPTVSIRVSADTYAVILRLANEEGCWIRSVVDRAVEEYVRKRAK